MDTMIGFELKSPVKFVGSQKEKYLSYFGIEVCKIELTLDDTRRLDSL
jgi:hypothetical protein